MENWPVGVFASVDAGLGVQLEIAQQLGVPTVQLHSPSKGSRTPERAAEFLAQMVERGIRITCVFAGFEGESYADIPTVARTVGLVPAETRDARTEELLEIAQFAKHLGVDAVGVHIGFVPHDFDSPDYAAIVATAQRVCDKLATAGQALHLETGQEPADVLLRFIGDVGRHNLLINFDPANMILYGVGEPIAALRTLGEYVQSVHCKDAKWSDQPGVAWGQEVPLGEGDVDIRAYLIALRDIGYAGPLTIEREIPQEPERQKAEVAHAVDLLNRLKTELAN